MTLAWNIYFFLSATHQTRATTFQWFPIGMIHDFNSNFFCIFSTVKRNKMIFAVITHNFTTFKSMVHCLRCAKNAWCVNKFNKFLTTLAKMTQCHVITVNVMILSTVFQQTKLFLPKRNWPLETPYEIASVKTMKRQTRIDDENKKTICFIQ